jgi:hypothetical protein
MKKKCLIIMPSGFYSYPEFFCKAFLSLGYIPTISHDGYPNSIIGSIMGKIHIPLFLTITDKVITEKFIKDETYDLILIIKGRGISVSLLQKLKQISPKIIGYNFDSFNYNKAPLLWFKFVNKYFTFDYRDAEDHNLPVVELFSSIPDSLKTKTWRYEISAIGRNHSKRLQYIDEVLSNIAADKKFIYIYEQNIFTLCENFIRHPFLYIKYKKNIFLKSLPYKDFTEVLVNSNFIIDYAHPSQTGITIRCFEALSCQTKIITNNPFVNRYEQFNATNTIVFNNSSDKSIFKDQYDRIYNQVPLKHKRTIYNFITDLISK